MPFPPRPIAMPLAGALTALAVLASGCGGPEPVDVEGRTLRLELDEYRIIPQNVRVREGRLRIVATNVGRLTHNVKIVRQDPEDAEAPGEDLGGTRSAQPAESTTVTFEDLRPGEYRLACTIANHDDLGQYGRLIVEADEDREE